MKKIVLTFGLISGAILATMTAIALPLCMRGTLDFDHAEIVGYTSMFLAFLLVFFGIRSYRDNVGGGTITFGKAFQVGILIALVTCAVYVVSWLIVYFNFIPDFFERYAAHVIEKMRDDGATDAAIAKKAKEMADFGVIYKNPLVNAGVTFMEVFPIGLIVTLISAAILRRKPMQQQPPVTAVA